MTHTTHNDEAIVDEFSTEWHRLGIPNGALPNMQDWLRQALAKARADQDRIARAEELEKIQKVMQILTYISTRNREHNAVCIPKAKEALEILTNQYNNTV